MLLALPLGELSPKVTERAHAVVLSAKVSSAMRNFPATAKSRPLGEGGCERSEQTEGVTSQAAFLFSRKLCHHAKGPISEGAVIAQR